MLVYRLRGLFDHGLRQEGGTEEETIGRAKEKGTGTRANTGSSFHHNGTGTSHYGDDDAANAAATCCLHDGATSRHAAYASTADDRYTDGPICAATDDAASLCAATDGAADATIRVDVVSECVLRSIERMGRWLLSNFVLKVIAHTRFDCTYIVLEWNISHV